ncbi:MAG TPA: DUF1156 domain-containing protein [Anaerolineaceae bacterium]|nr:DUF1156 domain-containing protein [Anaerolineaceae bacterium]
MNPHPPRLIEVDLPIRAISAHARREKSIRHGHISTLHIWWARRPLAACRAVLCAALWPDPADETCPPAFRDAAALALNAFAEQARSDARIAALVKDHWTRWVRTTPASLKGSDPACWPDLRYGLLDFIADFANWDASTVPAFLETARALTHVGHLALTDSEWQLPVNSDQSSVQERFQTLQQALANAPRPLVVDPFAGGGSIPLEALRVGADAFASDLNPVAVLLNKVVLEYIPKYGNARIELPSPPDAASAGRWAGGEGETLVFNGLAEAVRHLGKWIMQQADQELAEFYPKDSDGATPVAYLWARTIICEGPGCGASIPLIRSLWLARKGDGAVALQLVPDSEKHEINLEIIEKKNGKWYKQGDSRSEVATPNFEGTVRRSSATCPCCGYTTPANRVRAQFVSRKGGADDACLIAVVTVDGEVGRKYRLGTAQDIAIVENAKAELLKRDRNFKGQYTLTLEEELPYLRSIFNINLLGVDQWRYLFASRQMLGLTTLWNLLNKKKLYQTSAGTDHDFMRATVTCLALAIDRLSAQYTSLSWWQPNGEFVVGTFGRQALGIIWDFAEISPIHGASGDLDGAIDWVIRVLESQSSYDYPFGQVELTSATAHPLPDDSSDMFFTDPPYYDAVPYADLSDFFYTQLKRMLASFHPDMFSNEVTPKQVEVVQLAERNIKYAYKTREYFEENMKKALSEGRRFLKANGIGVVVFAHKTAEGWEAMLSSLIDAGWIATASWPIDTERAVRIRAHESAALGSSIHLVCRPRETADGELLERIGDWRDLLAALPPRIHAWLPRLAQEGVVGADAIFACLGPALEIFSRYSRVEKASGEQVTLKEYLEVVWAEVARQALGMIFEGADASGFEEDARLTAMWLWTLKGSDPSSVVSEQSAGRQGEMLESEDEEESRAKAEGSRYTLEYDAARKIAQGLGAHLERLEALVEVKGDKARLRGVAERAHALFGRAEDQALGRRKPKAAPQISLFSVLDEAEAQQSGWSDQPALPPGETSLDQLHQAMLLFASGRSEALKTFLVEQGVGKDQRLWRLAQALSALYPSGSDEKRWVDGVLARKKGLGF